MAQDSAIAILTVACEASNQGHDARVGVAASILNRVKDGRFGSTPAAVCLRRFQYSEWNSDAADNRNLERVASMADDDPVIVDCATAWNEAQTQDPTEGATHFFAESIPEPWWAAQATFTVQLDALRFYKDVP